MARTARRGRFLRQVCNILPVGMGIRFTDGVCSKRDQPGEDEEKDRRRGRAPRPSHATDHDRESARDHEALRVARATAVQLAKFDRSTSAAAKKFIKPIPYDELSREIDTFCELFEQPAVEAGLKKFVESTEPQPYLP